MPLPPNHESDNRQAALSGPAPVNGGPARVSGARVAGRTFDSLLGLTPRVPRPPIRKSAILMRESCERKDLFSNGYELRLRRRRKGRDEGSYGHIAQEAILSMPKYADGWPSDHMPLATSKAAFAASAAVARICADLKRLDIPHDRHEHEQFAAKGLACAVRAYVKMLAPLLASGWRILAVERTVQWTFRGAPCRATLDAVLLSPNGALWIWDLKTEGKSIERKCRLIPRSVEGAVYVLALDSILDELRAEHPNPGIIGIAGILHGVVFKPGIVLAKGETTDAYLRRCDAWWARTGEYINRRTENPESCRLHQQPLAPADLPPDQLARIEEYGYPRLFADDNGVTAADPTTHPVREGACSDCDFADLCLAPYARWGEILTRAYTTSPDPLGPVPSSALPTAKTPTGAPTSAIPSECGQTHSGPPLSRTEKGVSP